MKVYRCDECNKYLLERYKNPERIFAGKPFVVKVYRGHEDSQVAGCISGEVSQMTRPVNEGRRGRKRGGPSHPRVPGWKLDKKRTRRGSVDTMPLEMADSYQAGMRGRRTGPLPTLNDYDGSKI